jgi:hypothetical protein
MSDHRRPRASLILNAVTATTISKVPSNNGQLGIRVCIPGRMREDGLLQPFFRLSVYVLGQRFWANQAEAT